MEAKELDARGSAPGADIAADELRDRIRASRTDLAEFKQSVERLERGLQIVLGKLQTPVQNSKRFVSEYRQSLADSQEPQDDAKDSAEDEDSDLPPLVGTERDSPAPELVCLVAGTRARCHCVSSPSRVGCLP